MNIFPRNTTVLSLVVTTESLRYWELSFEGNTSIPQFCYDDHWRAELGIGSPRAGRGSGQPCFVVLVPPVSVLVGAHTAR